MEKILPFKIMAEISKMRKKSQECGILEGFVWFYGILTIPVYLM